MAFSIGPNPYFPIQPEPKDPFFSGFGITDSDEYYAKNNPFQKSGPRTTQKGAVVKIALAKSDDLYMRVDMPGVSKNKMFYFGDPYNFVYFEGSAPKEWEYDRRSGKEV
ncbi:putative 57 kda heat shock protein [Quercus suber]|uniref:57 kDa heat shock protein n=1 Tax=Quercus suber TaxID=58331 RepID=A0AAW0IRA7_QUESU